MLTDNQYERVKKVLDGNHSKLDINRVINKVRLEMNPHPAQQMTNVPVLDGEELKGAQQKGFRLQKRLLRGGEKEITSYQSPL